MKFAIILFIANIFPLNALHTDPTRMPTLQVARQHFSDTIPSASNYFIYGALISLSTLAGTLFFVDPVCQNDCGWNNTKLACAGTSLVGAAYCFGRGSFLLLKNRQ